MPRKKLARRHSKPTTKSKKATTVSVQKLENDFAKAPKKITAQLNKEIRALRQVEGKLTKALNKSAIQVNKAESRVQKVEAKSTPAAKKQLNSARKSHTKTLYTHNILNTQLEKTSHLLAVVHAKHAKLVALTKHLAKFEQDWRHGQKGIEAKPIMQKKTTESTKPMQAKLIDSEFPRMHEEMDELAETTS